MYYMSEPTHTMTPEDEGAHSHVPAEWWYQCAIFERSDSPISEWSLVSTFATTPERDGAMFLLFPPKQEPLMVVYPDLEAGAIQAARQRMDVRCGGHSVKGRYPEYELVVDGLAGVTTTRYAVKLKFVAEVAPFRREYDFQWWNVRRCRVAGSVTIGEREYPANGVGYFEHIWGAIQPREDRQGWLWYGIPQADAMGLSINTLVWIMPDGSFRDSLFTFSFDEGSAGSFVNYQVDVLETRIYEGLEYPSKLLYSGECEDGKFRLTLSRAVNEFRIIGHLGTAQANFITGPASAEGFMEYMGEHRTINGMSIGSRQLFLP